MERAFKGVWIPANIWLRKDISITEKVIFVEVNSLDNEFNCVASNKYIGEPLGVDPATVSRALKRLQELDLIVITYDDYNTHAGRRIKIHESYNPNSKINTPCENIKGACEIVNPPCEKVIHNNTFSNTLNTLSSNLKVELSTPTQTTVVLSASDKCHLFVDKFNSIKKSKYKANAKLCKALTERLKTYKSSEILKALSNAMKDDFHIKTKLRHITPEFILREDKLEKFLNQEFEEKPVNPQALETTMTDEEYEEFVRPTKFKSSIPEPNEY